MGKLEDYQSKAPAIIGSTTINHEARVRLGLNCSEYCLLDHLTRKDEKHQIADTLTVYINTGFTIDETERLLKTLVMKGFARIDNGKFAMTNKWDEAFADIEKEFENCFWKENGKVAWTGTRKKALEYYVKLRKRFSKDVLVKQRDDYFHYLRLQKQLRGFDQQRLMCQVFLNPANERFFEDYESYIAELKAKYGDPEKEKTKPLTKEEVMSSYGKNNNQ